MRKSKPLWAALAVMAVAALAWAATALASSKTHKVTNITLSGWSAGADEDNLLQQVVNTFNKTHKSIHVTYSVINGDYTTAMTARFAARNPPDVFYVDSSLAPTWASQGVLEPLNSYIKTSHYNTKPFIPGLLAAFKVGNQIYGFPKDWSPLAMEINNSMLAKTGMKAPTNWTQLHNVAQKMATVGAVPDGKPICLSPDWARMLAFIYQNKGSLSNVQSASVAAAVNYYVGLIKTGLAQTPDKLGAGWCGEALGKQKAAIIFEGNWVLPFMSSTYPSVGYKAYPMVKGKVGGNLGFTVSYSLAKSSKNKQAAWTLLSWLTGPQGMKLWVSKGLALPSRTDVKAIGGRKAFLAASPYVHGWGFKNFSNVYTVMNNDLTAVIAGSKTVPQMLSDVANAFKG